MLGINHCSASNVVDFLSFANLSIKISKGDGHCFLYSIKNGLNDQLGIKLDLADIKSKILAEFTSNKVRYEQFLTSNRNHMHDINNYIHFKTYNTSVCDLLPQITSNSLKVNIRIIDQCTNNSYNDIIIKPSIPTTTMCSHTSQKRWSLQCINTYSYNTTTTSTALHQQLGISAKKNKSG